MYIQAVKTRIKNKHDRKAWRRINKVTRPNLGRSCMQVQVNRNRQVTTSHDKDDIEREIQGECQSRFRLGHSAPISRSRLGDDLRYFHNQEIAEQILYGTYPIPDDMDYPTALMLTKMGRIGRCLRDRGHTMVSEVTTLDYRHYFSSINENTSSSPSGLHLGHDKAAALCPQLSNIFALHMNTIVHQAFNPHGGESRCR